MKYDGKHKTQLSLPLNRLLSQIPASADDFSGQASSQLARDNIDLLLTNGMNFLAELFAVTPITTDVGYDIAKFVHILSKAETLKSNPNLREKITNLRSAISILYYPFRFNVPIEKWTKEAELCRMALLKFVQSTHLEAESLDEYFTARDALTNRMNQLKAEDPELAAQISRQYY